MPGKPIEMQFEPGKIDGMTPAQMRNAFIATTLTQLPPPYRNLLIATGTYQQFWQDCIRIFNQYKTDMDAVAGGDWQPATKPRQPQTATPSDLVLSAIEASAANPKPTGPGKNKVPLKWK